ncbi:PREDICTED: uncharacterized protein LOC109584923 isoform X2 [Amphimedon queenslandica]|uniref:Death domain-containing protein n=1 Tax=Amphimedon queenslandica TaxID=400682 RepID=A0AAN0JHZ8_AMPQE|nr:PREDICTED: uncharacterized protein LOC109584923 isoform X2 [Amphimedon queenslandica]|eukprot:XP_019856397.1 PREDICTED: uncharacterized protein LOC109584923 isoform X2 [Amphimedon queenslandica]
MNGKPDLKTVCAIVRTSRWHQLGLQLGVDDKKLQEIDSEKSDTQEKRTQMFCAWINSQPGASHNQLVEALRLKVIGEDRMAREYEEKVKEEASKTHHTGAQVVQASTSTAPAWSTSTVINSITQKVLEVDLLTDQAYKLQDKYHKLLLKIQELSQNANVGIVKNLLRNILQDNCIYQSHGLSFYKQQIDGITSMDEVFAFLIENHFIGYLNYYLLMKFSSKVICGDQYKEAKEKVLKYEKHYRKFIDEPAFYQLIMFFDENPHLNPGTVVGLPIIVICLSQKWKNRNKKDLNEWTIFLQENEHILQGIGKGCTLITYAMFPVHLLKVMKFLSNKKIMERLRENGITIETPSYTLEIAERLREASTEELLEEEEDTSDIMQYQYFLLLEKVERIQEDRLRIEQDRLRDRAYYIVQIAVTRATERVTRYKFETSYEEKLNTIQKQIFEDVVELLKADTERTERIHQRKRSERGLDPEMKKKVSTDVSTKKIKTMLEASLEKPIPRTSHDYDDIVSGFDSGYATQGSSYTSRVMHYIPQ